MSEGNSSAPREIERKYLLRALPPEAARHPSSEMRQGYLPGREIHERVREERDGNVVTYTRTLKVGRGVERLEFEEPVDAWLFEGLYALTVGARVEKRRHRVPQGEFTWEIDDFTDRTLQLAEIELDRADRTVDLPDWLAPYVVREVTDEPAYLNLRLAR